MTTTLEPYEFRDPAALMAELAERISLDEGTAHLVLVDHPSTVQRIARTERLTTPAEILSGEDAEDEMRDVIDGWPLPEVRRPRHSTPARARAAGPVRVRPQRGPVAARGPYLNHLRPLYTGNCVLVTEHGWVDWMTYLAGPTPAMRAAA